MFLPTTLGTVESALVIIDYTIKFAKYLSPSIRRLLEKTRLELTRLDSKTEIGDANGVLQQQLAKYIQPSQINTSSWDMNHILDVMNGVVEEGLAWREQHGVPPGLPRYGDAIGAGLYRLTQKLCDWGFDQYRINDMPDDRLVSRSYIEPIGYKPIIGRYVQTRDLLSCIKKCRDLLACLPLGLRNGQVFYYWQQDTNGYGFHPTTWLVITKFTYFQPREFVISNQTIRSVDAYERLEKSQLEWMAYGVSIASRIRKDARLDFANTNYTLTTSDFEIVLSGLLTETLHFAGKVNRERSAVSEMLNRLYSKIRANDSNAK